MGSGFFLWALIMLSISSCRQIAPTNSSDNRADLSERNTSRCFLRQNGTFQRDSFRQIAPTNPTAPTFWYVLIPNREVEQSTVTTVTPSPDDGSVGSDGSSRIGSDEVGELWAQRSPVTTFVTTFVTTPATVPRITSTTPLPSGCIHLNTGAAHRCVILTT